MKGHRLLSRDLVVYPIYQENKRRVMFKRSSNVLEQKCFTFRLSFPKLITAKWMLATTGKSVNGVEVV
jgi:hypothetical protein